MRIIRCGPTPILLALISWCLVLMFAPSAAAEDGATTRVAVMGVQDISGDIAVKPWGFKALTPALKATAKHGGLEVLEEGDLQAMTGAHCMPWRTRDTLIKLARKANEVCCEDEGVGIVSLVRMGVLGQDTQSLTVTMHGSLFDAATGRVIGVFSVPDQHIATAAPCEKACARRLVLTHADQLAKALGGAIVDALDEEGTALGLSERVGARGGEVAALNK